MLAALLASLGLERHRLESFRIFMQEPWGELQEGKVTSHGVSRARALALQPSNEGPSQSEP